MRDETWEIHREIEWLQGLGWMFDRDGRESYQCTPPAHVREQYGLTDAPVYIGQSIVEVIDWTKGAMWALEMVRLSPATDGGAAC